MNICKSIKCPYFNSANNGYGCQKYQVSNHCHLIKQFPEMEFNPNQYALYSNEEIKLAEIKQANNIFFTNDEQYKNDLAFIKSHPGFTENMWKVGSVN